MRSRLLTFVCALAVPAFVTPSTSHADSIVITSGHLNWTAESAGVVSIQGGDGFSLNASVSPSGGVFTPWLQCFGTPDCVPGTAIDLYSFWNGKDLPGTATYQGATYQGVGGFGGDSPQAEIQFTGTAIAPASSGGVATAIAPFAFTGMFAYSVDPTQPLVRVGLTGGGTASLQLAEAPGGGYLLRALRFEFEEDAAPVPEPGSLLLLGSGFAGWLARRRLGQKRLFH